MYKVNHPKKISSEWPLLLERLQGLLSLSDGQYAAPVELSIVLPIYNEAENIPELYRRLTQTLELEKATQGVEILFINDGSSDRVSGSIFYGHRVSWSPRSSDGRSRICGRKWRGTISSESPWSRRSDGRSRVDRESEWS